MTKQIYVIIDNFAEITMDPFVARNENVMKRSLVQAMPDEAKSHAEDYLVFNLGEFDDESLEITSSEPELIGSLKNFITELTDREKQ